MRVDGSEVKEEAMAQPAEQLEGRTYAGISIPPVGIYEIDPAHTSLEFVARHMLTKVRGGFEAFSGKVVVAEEPEDSSVEVEIDAASVTTGNEQRDEHLRSGDFFAIDAHPRLTFRSTAFRPTGGSGFELEGELTIRGVTRSVTLRGEFLGWGRDGWGKDRVFAEARTRVNREDWGLVWNMAVELTGVLVAKEVDLELQVQAVRVSEP